MVSNPQTAQLSSFAKTRAGALRCLLLMSALPYRQLHPVKQTVLRGTALILDDKKRAVRRLAAKVRNEWSVLQ